MCLSCYYCLAMKTLCNSVLDRLGLGAAARNTLNRLRYMCNPGMIISNMRCRRKEAPDGFPLQTPGMVFLVSGQFDVLELYYNGEKGASWIRELLRRNSIQMGGRILDFGCGCGRVLRFWKDLKCGGGGLYGTDCNPGLIGWCAENLDFAEVTVNDPSPPTRYQDGFFDLVYAISVFTHLSEEMQGRWLKELMRITAPGGHIIITVHGRSRTGVLDPEQIDRFEQGELVIRGGRYSGSNVCGAYHPRNYLLELSEGGLEEVDYVESGATDAAQDVQLFRRTQ